jgi:hypothetical protein
MKRIKKVLSIVLAFVFVVSVVAVGAPTEAYAAKTTTITMVKGETFEWSPDYYNVKSISSSKKSVVSAKKNPDESTEVVLTAKEKGTSTVTIKTERGTKKYNVKVVGNSIKVKAVAQAGSYLIYKITNNTSVTFNYFYFDWTAKDSDGDTVKSGTDCAYYLTGKSTAYVAVYLGYGQSASVKKSKGSANFSQIQRTPLYTYKDQSSKVKVTVTDSVDGNSVDLKVKFKSSVNDYVSAAVDVILYDSNDDIIGIESTTKYLGKKETSTSTLSSYNTADIYDHCEVVVRAYTTSY